MFYINSESSRTKQCPSHLVSRWNDYRTTSRTVLPPEGTPSAALHIPRNLTHRFLCTRALKLQLCGAVAERIGDLKQKITVAVRGFRVDSWGDVTRETFSVHRSAWGEKWHMSSTCRRQSARDLTLCPDMQKKIARTMLSSSIAYFQLPQSARKLLHFKMWYIIMGHPV